MSITPLFQKSNINNWGERYTSDSRARSSRASTVRIQIHNSVHGLSMRGYGPSGPSIGFSAAMAQHGCASSRRCCRVVGYVLMSAEAAHLRNVTSVSLPSIAAGSDSLLKQLSTSSWLLLCALTIIYSADARLYERSNFHYCYHLCCPYLCHVRFEKCYEVHTVCTSSTAELSPPMGSSGRLLIGSLRNPRQLRHKPFLSRMSLSL
jgi:hypothetical protein